jgi:hypothetical protein
LPHTTSFILPKKNRINKLNKRHPKNIAPTDINVHSNVLNIPPDKCSSVIKCCRHNPFANPLVCMQNIAKQLFEAKLIAEF